MDYYLRTVKKPRWKVDEGSEWPGTDEVPADAVTDLKTTGNGLSLWLVDESKSNLKRIIAALAANRDRSDHLDYMLIRLSDFESTGIQIQEAPGDTADSEANRWHVNAIKITGTMLLRLAQVALRCGEMNRFRVGDVEALLREAVASGNIDAERMRCKGIV